MVAQGFEIGWHGATVHTSPRAETLEGLDRFRDLFGGDPSSMANHYNGEAIYWGPARLTGLRRSAYLALTPFRSPDRHSGHVEGHPCFWGDLCRERIRYCRNFVFSDVNTLRACPWMPYHDPARPWVNRWFAGSEGAKAPRSFALSPKPTKIAWKLRAAPASSTRTSDMASSMAAN